MTQRKVFGRPKKAALYPADLRRRGSHASRVRWHRLALCRAMPSSNSREGSIPIRTWRMHPCHLRIAGNTRARSPNPLRRRSKPARL
jgi:hypothetical protein